MAKYAVIIPAAGKSTRMCGVDKINLILDGQKVIDRVCKSFDSFDYIIRVGPDGDVPGGKLRQDSVFNGLQALPEDTDYVFIHDGARPFVSKELIERIKQKLISGSNAVIPCVKPKDTVRTEYQTLDRSKLFLVQTPQAFSYSLIMDCYNKAMKDSFEGTDDASIVEYCGIKVDMVEGDYANIKITTPDDLPKENNLRFGHGYDLHKLVEGRKLMLGCVEVPFEKGLLGHSDADVLAHAIADALLGATALGDIGKHFPDTSPDTEGMSGRCILEKTNEIINEKNFFVLSVDATLVAQRPKVAPYIDQMRAEISKALNIDISKVSVKATTEEGLGPTGEGLAMSAFATAAVKEN